VLYLRIDISDPDNADGYYKLVVYWLDPLTDHRSITLMELNLNSLMKAGSLNPGVVKPLLMRWSGLDEFDLI